MLGKILWEKLNIQSFRVKEPTFSGEPPADQAQDTGHSRSC
jgi:hypothetical protein